MYPTIYTYTGDGVATDFAVPNGYIHRSHIIATVAGTVASHTWANATTLRLSPAPAAGVAVVITRRSSPNARLVDYQVGAILDEETLDLDSRQAFNLAQESYDAAQESAARAHAADATANTALDTSERAAATADDARAIADNAEAIAQDARANSDQAVETAEAAQTQAARTELRLDTLITDTGNVPPTSAGGAGYVLTTLTGGLYAWQPPQWLPLGGGTLHGALKVPALEAVDAIKARTLVAEQGVTATTVDAAAVSAATATISSALTVGNTLTVAGPITTNSYLSASIGRFGGHVDNLSACAIAGDGADIGAPESTLKLRAKTTGRPASVLFETAGGASRTAMTYLDGVWNLGGFSLPRGTLWADHRGDAGARRNFYVYDSLSVTNAVLANRMVIDPDGRRAELYVNGDTTGYKFQHDGWRLEWWGSDGTLNYLSYASAVLWRCNNVGDTWAKSFNTLSDARLKEDVATLPAERCLEFVRRARPVSYRFRRHPEDRCFGFIAQDIETSGFTEMVSRHENPGVLDGIDQPADTSVRSLDYIQAIPLLTGALQNALERIDALEARLKEISTP